MARLKKLVTQLMSRTQLLSTLLKEAGISVPAEPALEKISPLKWSNKINVDDLDKYFDKIEESKYVKCKFKIKSNNLKFLNFLLTCRENFREEKEGEIHGE